ncbi:MAG: beta-galactosidase, partial [Oscillospiraceae bacterium]|nr:beta-galactosidase [Oscillospiraceae bacterium]
MLHGGDYNPEQWLRYPDILDKDIELMREAHINVVSLGIFSWADLEPEKDVFTFEWLDRVINKLWDNGIHTVLATPSGARPQWLAQEYPEVLRVAEDGRRNLFGHRHNHCYTSPAYRDRIRIMDTKLAQRYAAHPAVILWHISNEFGGECHCDLCQNAFRHWLKQKYGTLD